MIFRSPRSILFPYTTLFRSWFREILEFQNESQNAEEFMRSLKVDLFSDMVYVFTPKGDVIELPAGSVPIDLDRKSTRLNSSHVKISYAVFCLKKKNKKYTNI